MKSIMHPEDSRSNCDYASRHLSKNIEAEKTVQVREQPNLWIHISVDYRELKPGTPGIRGLT